MNSLSGGKSALKRSTAASSRGDAPVRRVRVPGDAQFAAQVEQVVLDAVSTAAGGFRQLLGQHHPDLAFSSSTLPMAAIRAESLATREPSAEAGAAGIAGTCDDLAESMAHAGVSGNGSGSAQAQPKGLGHRQCGLGMLR